MRYKKPKISSYKKLNKNQNRGRNGISKRAILIGIAIAVAVLVIAAIVVLAVLHVNQQKQEEFNNEISKIQVTHAPDKTLYYCGESFDSTGLSVYVRTRGGSYTEVSLRECTIEGFDSSVAVEQQTITVKYKGFQDTFTVVIKDPIPVIPTLESIAMDVLPKTAYKLGEGLKTSGGTFICTYSDGTTKTIELSNKYVYGFRDAYDAGVGEYDITVKYTEDGVTVETTYKITITE